MQLFAQRVRRAIWPAGCRLNIFRIEETGEEELKPITYNPLCCLKNQIFYQMHFVRFRYGRNL